MIFQVSVSSLIRECDIPARQTLETPWLLPRVQRSTSRRSARRQAKNLNPSPSSVGSDQHGLISRLLQPGGVQGCIHWPTLLSICGVAGGARWQPPRRSVLALDLRHRLSFLFSSRMVCCRVKYRLGEWLHKVFSTFSGFEEGEDAETSAEMRPVPSSTNTLKMRRFRRRPTTIVITFCNVVLTRISPVFTKAVDGNPVMRAVVPLTPSDEPDHMPVHYPLFEVVCWIRSKDT